MEEKTLILTGASSGLGRAAALEFLNHGYRVALVGRNEENLRSLIEPLTTPLKQRAHLVISDLADPKQVTGLYRKCKEALKTKKAPDVLLYCAGMAITGRIEEIPAEAWERCWRVNFSSAVTLAQQALPEMASVGRGMILNVTSGVARRALPFISPYCSAKAALHSFTESLRVEVAGLGITVAVFSPGPVDSGFHGATEHFGNTVLAFPPFQGKPAEEIGKKLFQAVQKRKERVVLGLSAKAANQMNLWSPKFMDGILARKFRALPHSEPAKLARRSSRKRSRG